MICGVAEKWVQKAINVANALTGFFCCLAKRTLLCSRSVRLLDAKPLLKKASAYRPHSRLQALFLKMSPLLGI